MHATYPLTSNTRPIAPPSTLATALSSIFIVYSANLSLFMGERCSMIVFRKIDGFPGSRGAGGKSCAKSDEADRPLHDYETKEVEGYLAIQLLLG